MVHKGSKVAVLALGNFFELGEKVCTQLEAHGIDATLINPRFISGIDTEMLNNLSQNHSVVVTLEDGAIEGGFGEKIARYLGASSIKTLCYGAKKQFADRYKPADFLAENRLVDTMIADDVMHCLQNE